MEGNLEVADDCVASVFTMHHDVRFQKCMISDFCFVYNRPLLMML
jgi:hypothetical protein